MENIGKYRIEERIGVGGFGQVFKAYDPFIKRHVAVKTCSSDDSDVKSRFFQEAEIAGNLHHRNITTVYDFGVHDGLPYLIQEYLSGEDLDAKIKRRDFLPYAEKLYYLLQIARGLAYAHSNGVIHRDIKPANIRILEDGTARIMDFGIAKLAQQESGLTQTGMTLGTAAYLAPEQVRADPVDHRTDIFSYGVLAYELLTYERPFHGEQISTLLYNLLHQEPKPMRELWPEAPAELAGVVDRCLAKNADQRFADGSELVKELEALQKRGRGGRVSSASSDADSPTPTVHYGPSGQATQPVRTSSAAPAAPAAKAAPPPPPRPDAAVPMVERLENQRIQLTPNQVSSPTASIAVQASPRLSSPVLAGLLALAAVAAGAGGWWFGMRDPSPATAQTGAAVPEAAEGLAPQDAAGEAPPQPEPATEAGTAESAGVEGTELAEAAVPEPLPEPPPAPPPPAPTTGELVLPRVGWTDAMTVRIGGTTYSLGRERTLELEAGSYEAVFELDTAVYSPAPHTVPLRLAAGGRQRLAVPILPPGFLTVRPLPGKPQGEVLIDGQALGPTPQSRVQRSPGSYVVEIRPRGGDGEASVADRGLTESLVLESGQEVILSFDLEAGSITARTKEPSP